MRRADHPNWVTFETVNALRFPYNPVAASKWRRWCREERVPACMFPDGWRIDLVRFDKQFGVQNEPSDADRTLVAGLSERLRA